LQPGDKAAVTPAALVLPLGLKLANGVTLQIDDEAPLPRAAFRTCMPAGCIAQIDLTDKVIASARKGKAIKVSFAFDNATNNQQLNLSLKGFSKAYDRTAALRK
jgi:invasion protein IalB